MTRTPTLGEVIRNAIDNSLESVHTSIPGVVVKYNPSTQLADVKPLIKHAYEDENGDRQLESLPVVPNCPVKFSGGAGLVLIHPVAVGDIGILLFSQASLDRWLSSDGSEEDPNLDHRHHITDGMFIPGIRTGVSPRSTDPGSAVCIGVDGGSFEGAALATRLAALFNTHVHSGGGSGPPAVSITADTNPTTGFASGSVKITP